MTQVSILYSSMISGGQTVMFEQNGWYNKYLWFVKVTHPGPIFIGHDAKYIPIFDEVDTYCLSMSQTFEIYYMFI